MKNLAVAYAMKRKGKSMKRDGESHEMKEPSGDLVDRIIKKKFAEGGMVSEEKESDLADDMSADYDYLDTHSAPDWGYTGANSGDELGNEQESEDRKDIVARIMRSRSKKDRMPNPA